MFLHGLKETTGKNAYTKLPTKVLYKNGKRKGDFTYLSKKLDKQTPNSQDINFISIIE